ncbi:TetR/AcrR family transcriptional regulator C-terminal domain-containing protein [Devosia sp. A16]|uniref:TetR/AcrR family transcriptional regulator C-terminal domain-containing protein n=1 Tax=Devosia sp. A16 TaxID=1736675 RepID=UPI0006D7E210|nr:TetR/AcrR family transcriptional regulator C-terminal domain-containing protein [Devosia sp. A16]
MAVTRDDVIHTAIQLMQEVGLDGLTLRRLAQELGISAPTLYWHVKDKRELLDVMAETMVADQRAKQPPFPTDLPWDEKVAEGLRRQYQALTAYRDGARVVAGNRPTERAMPQIENFLKIWVDAGFSPEEALASILSMGDYVTGSALEYQAEMERRRTQPAGKQAEIWSAMASYPTLHAAAQARMKQLSGARFGDSFEHGLRLLMAGLRARHTEIMAEKAKAAHEARPRISKAD